MDTDHSSANSPALLLGQLLVQKEKISQIELERLLQTQQETEQRLDSLLVNLGIVTEQEMAVLLSEHLNVKLLSAEDYPSLAIENTQISVNYMRSAELVPVAEQQDQEETILTVAMTTPADTFILTALAMASNATIQPQLGLPSEIKTHIERLYGDSDKSLDDDDDIEITGNDDDLDDVEQLKDMASEAPVIRLVNQIMTHAMTSRASDIHIEPFEAHLKVRYRIDGVIQEQSSPPKKLTAAIISRIKLMARLNIAERRLPQDGRIQFRAQGKEIDMRVSTVPTMYGESIVMRLLDKKSIQLELASLGFSEQNFQRIQAQLKQPHGVLLVTGPTGSGKTTTLYAALNQLNTSASKILTVEDPVEYELEGINQIQANPKIGLSFSDALRSIVRQDPDIIMIGEMRDAETARIAIQSALTGHLVLSTIHTNDAGSAITRLMDMGVEDYLLTSSVNGIIAQRLVRRLCSYCRQEKSVLPEIIQELQLRKYQGEGEIKLWSAQGCEACNNTGYKGRSAIHEVLILDDSLRRLILKHADSGTLQEQAKQKGMQTLYEDGLRKALAGITTLEEILRVAEDNH
jgi:general secretion pathway protein E